MNIRDYLAQGKPLLFDGAMGTYFASRPGRAETRCELANLDRPEEITAIHRAYLEAGACAIRTNTFDVGTDGETAQRIIRAGCRLALEAARPFGAYVFADLGPAPREGTLSPRECYRQQAEVFLDQGMTCFVVETLSSDEGVPELARYIKERCPEAFLLVSFAVGADGMTREGLPGRALFERAAALDGVDAVGFNCVSGPHHLLEYVRGLDLSVLNGKFLSVMPNAGYPTVLGRRVVYQGQADYFAAQMADIARAGAAIVGGCCGTTPQHIARTAAALEGLSTSVGSSLGLRPNDRSGGLPTTLGSSLGGGRHSAGTVIGASPQRPVRQSADCLWDKLEAGKRVIAVELDPPADDQVDGFMEGVRALRDAGADAITVSDCPVGRPRADSSLLACKIRRETGMEPLPHMTCRDRNLNATKALLLGLSMEGVRNVLLVTGDPVPTENRDEVKSVFNFNSRKLIRYVSGLTDHGLSAPFQIFGALNVNAVNFQKQLELALEKEEAGAAGFLTQPVHSSRALENLALAHQTLKGKILGGVFPIVSHRNALFLNNEVAGVSVPEEIVRMYEGKSREAAEELAVELSVKAARDMEPYTDGWYLMTPFRRVELITRIMAELK
ncbi:MAG: bifunctional homocysteine S-methyltransferase/methylenetetrahydrofolate reductase [Oscillospiraceae bacterium]|nr:bifunctional homocysteine S-methyltransferase/methylenetetrahydrofolate reductase [Oscillospiraceae bacterium]MDE7171006.1 bifunctional homocysteine S-methyltransferase/methylenetetrahydrofolate reductase [Oscillospiraceae bacterium]